MPELPEVETVRRVLKTWLVGKRIIKCFPIYPNIIANMTPEEFALRIEGQEIKDIGRKGKYLLIYLENDVIISHLRMEGKYHLGYFGLRKENDEANHYFAPNVIDKKNKHVHLVFLLDDNRVLMYDDVRKFGRMNLVKKEELFLVPPLNKLGIEANSDDYSASYLFERLQKLKVTIKQALLNQELISGLGNIYVDEVLFLSKIKPTKEASKISLKKCQVILDNAKIVLNKAIELGGSTIRSYHFANGVDGKFQNELYVYGRANQECKFCGSKINKIKVGGRGTHYCPSCQK